MKVYAKEVNQIKKWKLQNKFSRILNCPFRHSVTGGLICNATFKKCSCLATPCPCEVYTFDYVMRRANRIIKYRET